LSRLGNYGILDLETGQTTLLFPYPAVAGPLIAPIQGEFLLVNATEGVPGAMGVFVDSHGALEWFLIFDRLSS
jgi:hypothetical protein